MSNRDYVLDTTTGPFTQTFSWGSPDPIRTNGEGRPVVALDIDGTLGDYHQNFFNFARLYFGPGMTAKWDPDEVNPGLPLWQHLEIPQHVYREAKLAYRQGGWKRWMPAYPGASELTQEIRSAGAEVWLCTTRPYLRLDNVDPDTREWLRRNDIHFDALIFDPLHDTLTKYDELRRQAGSRVASVVDDLPEMISAAQANGWVPILRDQPYNQHTRSYRRAKSCQEILVEVRRDLDQWTA